MKKVSATTMLALLLLLISGAFYVAAQGSRERVEFPSNFRQTMFHYATVDRPDGKIYEIFIDRTALPNVRQGEAVPSGTRLVIESFLARRNNNQLERNAQGRLVKDRSEFDIHVIEKRNDWQSNNELTSGAWRVGAFDPRDGKPTPNLNLRECHECHTDASKPSRDFVFSWGLLGSAARSGQTVYFSCRSTAREPC
jgi:hypothetical protein